MSRAIQTAALRVGASVAALVLVNVALTPVHADSTTPAFATQHALDELRNAIAQGKITLTPTPSATATSTTLPATSTATLVVATDTPTVEPTATATEAPCWLQDDDGAIVYDEDGAPVPCPPDIPAEETPTDIPTETLTPTLTPTPQPTSAPMQPQIVYVYLPAATVEPTSTLEPTDMPTATAVLTSTALSTMAPFTTSTPILTPTATATRTSAATATVTPRPSVTPIHHVVAPVVAPAPREQRPPEPRAPLPSPTGWDMVTMVLRRPPAAESAL